MNADVAFRYEATTLVEALYALKRGAARWICTLSSASSRVPEKVVSKPATPKFYEVAVPLFRFISYPGGKAVLTSSDVAAAETRIEAADLKEAWDAHHTSKSAIVFETKRTGYLERRTSKEVAAAAGILWEEVGVEREAPLEPKIINPATLTYRVFSAELADEHVAALADAAATGTTIKFKGQPHAVKAVQGGWNVMFNRFDVNYDLVKVRK